MPKPDITNQACTTRQPVQAISPEAAAEIRRAIHQARNAPGIQDLCPRCGNPQAHWLGSKALQQGSRTCFRTCQRCGAKYFTQEQERFFVLTRGRNKESEVNQK